MSLSEPAARTSAASVSTYPSSFHCSPATPACRSRPIDGNATLTTVASSSTIASPSTATASTQRPAAEASRTDPGPPPSFPTNCPLPSRSADDMHVRVVQTGDHAAAEPVDDGVFAPTCPATAASSPTAVNTPPDTATAEAV